MTNRTISGVMHVTLAVPFTVGDWLEEDEAPNAEAWMRGVNNGSLPDAMEGADMAVANSNDHEVVAWEIESADYEPEPHDSGRHESVYPGSGGSGGFEPMPDSEPEP